MLKLSPDRSSSWRAGQQAQTSQSRTVLPACGMKGGPKWALGGLGRASTGPCCPQCQGKTLGFSEEPTGEWWDLRCPRVCSFLTLLTVAIHSFSSENCNLSLSFSTLGNPVVSGLLPSPFYKVTQKLVLTWSWLQGRILFSTTFLWGVVEEVSDIPIMWITWSSVPIKAVFQAHL